MACAPISVLIATADRADSLARCLATLGRQEVSVREVVVVDASRDAAAQAACEAADVGPIVKYVRAASRGAAVQRSEGLARTSQPLVLFLDDDVELEEACIGRLWDALRSDDRIGGASAMLVNQRYSEPGRVSRALYRTIAGGPDGSLAGRCIGPVVTFWPADSDDLPEVVPVEWLNSTCTLYRRVALPSPLFPDRFVGYSLGEDVCLSLTVAKHWRLVNARTAHALHRTREGPHKPGTAATARMSLVNRHYIMTKVLHRRSLKDYAQLAAVEILGLLALTPSPTRWRHAPAAIAGRTIAVFDIVTRR